MSSWPGSSSTVRLQRSITSTPNARPDLTRYLHGAWECVHLVVCGHVYIQTLRLAPTGDSRQPVSGGGTLQDKTRLDYVWECVWEMLLLGLRGAAGAGEGRSAVLGWRGSQHRDQRWGGCWVWPSGYRVVAGVWLGAEAVVPKPAGRGSPLLRPRSLDSLLRAHG